LAPWYQHVIPTPNAVLISKDHGTTWLPSNQIETAPNFVGWPTLLPGTDSLALAWNSEFLYYLPYGLRSCLLFGYQPYGTAKPGTGSLAPRLDGNGEPHTGSTAGVTMSQALGGSPAAIVASFAGPASLPFFSGTLLVQPPLIAIFGITSSGPGGGTLSLPLAIPAGTAFRNLRIDFQGFVLDPGAADGFAATAGLEMWTY